jgi:uncharacterized protein (TIGR04255 family)
VASIPRRAEGLNPDGEMLANITLKPRPADLPEFLEPPLAEVALGVQFKTLDRFLSPHLGLLWDELRPTFPHVEERMAIPPAFETFGPNPQFMPLVGVQLSAAAEMPRVFFINSDRTQLLQVQRDRFLHNWRKIKTGGEYPRFERMLSTFVEGMSTFESFLERHDLGKMMPNQVELTYINQIPVPEKGNLFELFKTLFPQQADVVMDNLGAPEDVRFFLRYVIRENETPIGRLIVAAEPARRADGVSILQVSLTARGKPSSDDVSGVVDFLQRGRVHIVRTFTKLTGSEMHKTWGRTQ